MNPRVSRSSALASKATGFPIAKIAAKLAIGYTLDEIPNDITARDAGELRADARLRRGQGAAVRVREVPGADPTLTTHMKSVGEAMAIGRTFTEALQKALRSLEQPDGAVLTGPDGARTRDLARRCSTRTRTPHDGRLGRRSQQALRRGRDGRRAARGHRRSTRGSSTRSLLHRRDRRRGARRPPSSTPTLLRRAKRHGFSDAQLGALRGMRRGRRPRRAARARRPPGLQDRRHLRRRVRRAHAVPLLVLRRGDRGRAARASRR